MPAVSPPENTIRIEGLAELSRAFGVASRGLARDMRSVLESAAESVKLPAQQKALTGISRISLPSTTVPWHQMRVGVLQHVGYVAPVQRGVKSRTIQSRRREKFKTILLDRAMIPALDDNRSKAVQEFEDALRDMGKAWARV